MTSVFVKVLYSMTYFSHLAISSELYLLWQNKDNLDFHFTNNIYEGICDFLRIYYPLIIFLMLFLTVKNGIKYLPQYLQKNTLKMSKSTSVSADCLIGGLQLAPYITLFINLVDKAMAIIILVAILFLLVRFFIKYPTFNLTVFLCGYNQYKVSTGTSEYWIISKTKIYDFSRSISIVELTDKVLLKV